MLSAAAGGSRYYSPGRWSGVNLTVTNPTDQAVDVLSVFHFAKEPHLQFVRRLWMPAKSQRSVWQLVRPSAIKNIDPDSPTQFDRSMAYRAFLVDVDEDAREELISKRNQDGIISSIPRRQVTALIDDRTESDFAYQAVVALRIGASVSRIVNAISENLPTHARGYDGVRQVVVSSNRIASDLQGLRALRQWLFEGGHLWIMLDRVDPETVALLLGDAFTAQIVDEVDLTEVLLDWPLSVDKPPPKDRQPRKFEEPIKLVRVLTDDRVLHTINGWPASFTKPIGRGDVVFTTVGPRAWIEHRTGRQSPDPRFQSAYSARPPLKRIGDILFATDERQFVDSEELKPYVADQIGFHIAKRANVIAILGSFCGLLVVLGLWFARRERLELFRWVGPGAAIVAAGAFLVMGLQAKQAVPPTVAESQFVEVANDTGEIHARGTIAFYNQTASSAKLGGEGGELLFPELAEEPGTTRRMVWNDGDSFQWNNLTLPPGPQFAEYRGLIESTQPVRAVARFGPNGLSGELERGSLDGLEDAIIATPSRDTLAVSFGPDKAFVADRTSVLGLGEYVRDALLSDEQRRRQTVYRGLLSGTGNKRFPAVPTLLTWAEPLTTRLTLPPDIQRVGSALVSIPLDIARTPPDSDVVVSAPFLPYRVVSGPEHLGPSQAYNNVRNEWLRLSKNTTVWLRFQIPFAVRPLDLQRATVSVKFAGLAESVALVGLLDNKQVTLESRANPLGVLDFAVEDVEFLALDDNGGLLFGLTIQVPPADEDDPEAVNYWQFDYVRLEVTGRTNAAAQNTIDSE